MQRITITQTPSPNNADGTPGAYPDRNKTFSWSFITAVEINENWKNLTSTAKIIVPKNIYVNELDSDNPDGQGSLKSWYGAYTKNLGGFLSGEPLILRGDKIKIEFGYDELITEFTGFVSSITVKMPVVIECEDNMWKLKQVQCPNKLFPASTHDLNTLMKELLQGTGFTFVSGTSSNPINISVGDIRCQNETVAQLLDRFRKDLHLYFYFSPTNPTELRGGILIYYPQDFIDASGNIIYNDFIFQQNIISHTLKYSRKDDVSVGARCYSTNRVAGPHTNKQGATKFSTARLETTVGNIEPKGGGDSEVFSFWFPNVTTLQDLKNKGNLQLSKYNYNGLKGKFKTFAHPSIHMCQVARITEPNFASNDSKTRGAMPERNGSYLIRSVKKTLTVEEGIKQEVDLHFRIDEFAQAQLQAGL